jgi:hypothetical protein
VVRIFSFFHVWSTTYNGFLTHSIENQSSFKIVTKLAAGQQRAMLRSDEDDLIFPAASPVGIPVPTTRSNLPPQ